VTPGLPLGLVDKAVTVRVADGDTHSTPGTYAADAPVGGYFVLDAETIDDAINFAARIPAARLGGAIEVRPSEQYW